MKLEIEDLEVSFSIGTNCGIGAAVYWYIHTRKKN
jgi:hypothetical protein